MNQVLLYLPMMGCLLLGFYFVFFGVWNTWHWTPTLAVMKQKNIPFSPPFLLAGIVLQTIAGLMLMLGIFVPWAALILIPFDIIAVFIFHPFWQFNGEIRRLNMIIFIANLTSTLGFLLLLSSAIWS